MKRINKSGNSEFSITSNFVDKTEDDMFDINEMLHNDYTVLGQIEQLISKLKFPYQGLSDTVHKTVCDLQKMITRNSCSLTLQDVVRNSRYIFQMDTPELRDEWCKEFLLAKLAIDYVNTPGWDISYSSREEIVIQQPSLFMKWLGVDMPGHHTKMVHAVPFFRSSSIPTEMGMQHLCVVTRAENHTNMAIFSTQPSNPVLIESFKATEHEAVALETVPGYAVYETENAFIEDTVWMSTTNSELFDEAGRHHCTTAREPRITSRFSSVGIAMEMRYRDNRMFVGLGNGVLVIYDRHGEDGKWNIDSPNTVTLGTTPINSIIHLEEDVLVLCGSTVYIMSMRESASTDTINMACDDNSDISDMVKSGVGLWVSYKEKPLLHLYHIETKQHLQGINVESSVERMVTGNLGRYSELLSKRCFVTSLMASGGFLWVGTNLGIVLNYRLPRLHDGVPLIHGRANVCYHSHNGPVKFLTPINYGAANTLDRAQALDTRSMSREDDNLSKTKTMTFRRELAQKLQDRQHGTVAPETTEREIIMLYGDLLHNDTESGNNSSDAKKIVKGYRNQPVAIQKMEAGNTIQRRNCNVVLVVSGGDGYTDWRSPLKDSPKHNDASLMFWMYKF